MAYGVGQRGVLRIVSPDELTRQEADASRSKIEAEDRFKAQSLWDSNLAAYVDGEFQRFQRHRDGGSGWSDRLVDAMRVFKGEYTPTKLAEIRQFGGSEIYARVIAGKCRSASSLLRDVYLNTEKPWALEPSPDPKLPDDILGQIQTLVTTEMMSAQAQGVMTDPTAVRDRVEALVTSAFQATVKKARQEALRAQTKLDDHLVEGLFYEALAAFIVDLPLFPFACIKGPVVRIVPQITYVNGKAVVNDRPKMFWNRVSPFDVWWTPGIASIADACVIERSRLTRSDLNQLLGLPGYNEEAIRTILVEYGRKGYVEANASSVDTPRALMESREDPRMNESGLIDLLEYHGYVQGRLLLDYGLAGGEITDPDRDYFVDAFKVGRHIIKAQLSPSLRKRPPYYVTSFEKVPGTVVGNALPDILTDIGDACNATMRSLVNNMSIASGPQVDVNDDRLAENENGEDLYPWKRWHTTSDPMGNNSQPAIRFFQPASNAQELMVVYEKFTQMADEISAIPRYITGSDRMGGAGRTASGLAMLMGNSSKILQMVAANIDGDVIEPVVSELYDMVMMTDQSGTLRGDENIVVKGVSVAMQRETERQRQLEFLQITANPIDLQITGIRGRANVLRAVSNGIGLEGDEIVPPDDQIAAQEQLVKAAGGGAPPPEGGGGGAPGASPPGAPAQPPGAAAPGGPPSPPGVPGPPGQLPGMGAAQQKPTPTGPKQMQTNTTGPARGP